MLKILVIGSTGQVGNEIKRLSQKYRSYDFVFVDRILLDLSEPKKIIEFFSYQHFEVIINCAAYTAVDKAEVDFEIANVVNNTAVSLILDFAIKSNALLIHISTDYVFDGSMSRPYLEGDLTNPLNVYGKTKRAGELAILNANYSKSVIIRTSWIYSGFGANFVKTMVRISSNRNSLSVVSDQIGTPTYARDLAFTILEIIPRIQADAGPAIYHFSNEGVASWFDFSKSIFELLNIKCTVHPITSIEFPTTAKRPQFSLLSKLKIKNQFGLEIPYWRDSLADCLKSDFKDFYKG